MSTPARRRSAGQQPPARRPGFPALGTPAARGRPPSGSPVAGVRSGRRTTRRRGRRATRVSVRPRPADCSSFTFAGARDDLGRAPIGRLERGQGGRTADVQLLPACARVDAGGMQQSLRRRRRIGPAASDAARVFAPLGEAGQAGEHLHPGGRVAGGGASSKAPTRVNVRHGKNPVRGTRPGGDRREKGGIHRRDQWRRPGAESGAAPLACPSPARAASWGTAPDSPADRDRHVVRGFATAGPGPRQPSAAARPRPAR